MTQPPTVILLHSSASSSRQWDALVQLLACRFRVHAVDLHGHGRQAPWSSDAPFTLADEATLVSPLLGTEGAHVVGHSYGGAVALKLASMYPEHVHSVVAYEPVLFRWLRDRAVPAVEDVIAVADMMCDRLWEGDEHAAARYFVDFWSGAGAWDSLPVTTQHAIATRIRVVAQQFDALFQEPLQLAQLARLKMPMLLLTGARTVPVMQCMAQELRSALPAARHEVLQGAAHMGPITHAAEVNGRLAEFLHQHAAREPALELAEAA